MTPDQDTRDTPDTRAAIEGPVAQQGDVTLSGRYVAAHDIHVTAPPPEPESALFLTVDRDYLEEQARQPKRVYVARSPDWADVVHGTDPDLRFIERDQTEELRAAVRDELLAPIVRGTDRRLHSLFVLGAPGSGKTTLVRRVAALLVLAGECVIADFGVRTERVAADEIAAVHRALDKLAAQGTPVLVLLDDPFFANSGWVELLQTLGRPQHQGIAVLGASPDFLFSRFAHWLFGKQVVGRKFDVSRPSAGERERLALLHHRDPAASSTTDEDLLVVAMEAAAGQSFRDIMQHIWMTLNNGVQVDPTADVRRLPWQVVAFAVICFCHRNYVLCPESLLHEFLSDNLDETPPSYLARELQAMVTQEGWRIFSVHGRADGRLIGTTHARVAREAWQHRPMHGLDVPRGIVEASVRAPAAVPQIAELILAQPNQLAKRFAGRWTVAVERGTTDTKSLCALVRALKPSRPSRLVFKPVLRKCKLAQNDQSWLAVWQLYHLSSTLNPTEHDFLLRVDLPWTLKIGDLSAGPAESIEIADRLREFRTIVVDRLTQSLRGELDWRPDARQVKWLLTGVPAIQVGELLDHVYRWLDEDLVADEADGPSRAGLVVEALLSLRRTTALFDDDDQRNALLGAVFDWLATAPEVSSGVLATLIDIADSTVDSDPERGMEILAQLFEWLCARPEGNEPTWAALLAMVSRLPGATDLVRDMVPGTFDWLLGRAESNEAVWNVFLAMVGRLPGATDLVREIVPQAFAWLKDRPENNESAWNALFNMLGKLPDGGELAREIVPDVFVWLAARTEPNESAWSGFLTILGKLPDAADLVADILPRVVAWLLDRPENFESAWAALFTTLGRLRGATELVRDIVPKGFDRLMERAESNESSWAALLILFVRVQDLGDLAEEIVPQAFERLIARPEDNETAWTALLSALGRMPDLAQRADEIVSRTYAWLTERSAYTQTAFRVLFAVFWRVPGMGRAARELVPQAFDLLIERSEPNDATWGMLFAALGRVPDLADVTQEIVSKAYAWLRARPENNEAAWRGLFSVIRNVPELHDLAPEIVPAAFVRLNGRPETNEAAWAALLAVVGQVPQLAGPAREIVPLAFARLMALPGNHESAWNALLITLGRLPGATDLAREILPPAFERLMERPENNESAWNALLITVGRLTDARDLACDIVPRTFVWLTKRPANNETAWRPLFSLLGHVPELAEVARDIVPRAYDWLKGRPGSNRGAWAGLLIALSCPIEISPALRAEMLAALHGWFGAYDDLTTLALRGVRLVQLADQDDPRLLSTLEDELRFLEDELDAKALPLLAPPVAYAIRHTGRADLAARFAAWEQRTPDDGHSDDDDAEDFPDDVALDGPVRNGEAPAGDGRLA